MITDALNFKDYIDILKRRKWSLILPAVGIFLAAAAIALVLPPVYKSTSKILIEEQEVPTDFVTSTVSSYAEQRLETINQRIMSSTRLAEIVRQFNLYRNLAATWTMDEITKKMRDDIELEMISAEVLDKRTKRSKEATIAFTLSYQGRNPEVVQRVTSILASLYMEENIKVRERQVADTAEFLDNEIKKMQTELAEVESRIAVFKQENINQLPDLLQSNTQELDRLETAIAGLEDQLRSLKEHQDYLRMQSATIGMYLTKDGGPGDFLTERQKLEALKVDYQLLASRYLETHPDIVRIKAEIARLENELADQPKSQATADKTVAGAPQNPAYVTLEMQLANTAREIASVERQIQSSREKAAEFRRRIETTPRIEGTYRAMIRQRDNLQAKVNDLLKKLMETRVAEGLEKAQKGERFTIIDPARLPGKPYKPNRLAILLIGLVLGIGAGAGLVVLREVTDNTVWTVRELGRVSGLAVLGGIPEMVTPAAIRKKRVRRSVLAAAVTGVIVTLILCVHLLVMDVGEIVAAIVRRIAI